MLAMAGAAAAIGKAPSDSKKKIKRKADDDDPIVDEIPIYVSKRLAKNIGIVQYPLMPSYTEVDIEKLFYKPKNKEARMELPVNTEAMNYDTLRAENLVRLVDSAERDSKDKKVEKIFNSHLVDKIFLKSSKAVIDTSMYAIGAFNGREWHWTPLHSYLQMHPNIDYIDRCLKHKKKEAHEHIEDEEPGPSSAQAVTVKFAKGEADKHIRAKDMTYKQYKERSDAEKWLECELNEEDSEESRLTKQKLLTENYEDRTHTLKMPKQEYLKLLVPEDKEQAVIKPSLPSHVVSLHALRALPVQEQCRVLLKDTKMIQFQQLMLLLASGKGITHETVLKNLPQVAVLVRGIWVAKSDLLYPQNSFSAVSGVAAEQMCKARDYVVRNLPALPLYLFTKQDYVERRKVSQTVRLPTEEVKEIFTGVSRLKHNKGWKLLLAEDVDFLAKHADIAERQKRLWEQRWQQLNEFYKECPRVERKRKKSRSIGGEHEIRAEVKTEFRIKRESVSSDGESVNDKIVANVKKHYKRKNIHDVPIKTEIDI